MSTAVAREPGRLRNRCRRDGSFCHTLNTADGLPRKLRQLGLGDLVPPPTG